MGFGGNRMICSREDLEDLRDSIREKKLVLALRIAETLLKEVN